MTEGELHAALADVARTARRGGYDVDEEAEVLARVVHDYANQRAMDERNRTLADARAVVERETDAYPGASPSITSGIWGGFDQWAMSEYGTLADPDRRICGKCGQRHTQCEYDDAHRNDEGGW